LSRPLAPDALSVDRRLDERTKCPQIVRVGRFRTELRMRSSASTVAFASSGASTSCAANTLSRKRSSVGNRSSWYTQRRRNAGGKAFSSL
jgi:hypothetical protein